MGEFDYEFLKELTNFTLLLKPAKWFTSKIHNVYSESVPDPTKTDPTKTLFPVLIKMLKVTCLCEKGTDFKMCNYFFKQNYSK